jgi:hypothetical protein
VSAEDPYDWWAGAFGLFALGMGAWWLIQGGSVLVAAGFVLIGLIGFGKWWWGK